MRTGYTRWLAFVAPAIEEDRVHDASKGYSSVDLTQLSLGNFFLSPSKSSWLPPR